MKNISASEYGLEKLLDLLHARKTFHKNNISLMNENLKKAYMKRNRLQYQFLKTRSSTNTVTYNGQKIFVCLISRKTKMD